MTSGVLYIAIVIGAYLAAHVTSEWMARRFMVVSGVEYLLLGVLLGPEVSGIIQASSVDGFAPFMTLAFGWVGALVGAQFHLGELSRMPSGPFRVGLAQAVVAGAALTATSAAVLAAAYGLPLGDVLVPAIALGAIGVASAPAGIALVTRRIGQRSGTARQLQVATSMDALVAITVFGVLLAVTHTAPPPGARAPTATEWVVISLAVGVVGGLLFHLFLGSERDRDRLFIALSGALVLCSGAAAHLRISPLLPSMLVGSVLVNTSPFRGEIREVLIRVERPLYFVLLIFAGARWEAGSAVGWGVALGFVALRVLTRVAAARLAGRLSGKLTDLGGGWGWGLIGHGGLAVAMALNYRLYDPSPLARIVFTAALASVVATDLFAPQIVARVAGGRQRRPAPVAREPEV